MKCNIRWSSILQTHIKTHYYKPVTWTASQTKTKFKTSTIFYLSLKKTRTAKIHLSLRQSTNVKKLWYQSVDRTNIGKNNFQQPNICIYNKNTPTVDTRYMKSHIYLFLIMKGNEVFMRHSNEIVENGWMSTSHWWIHKKISSYIWVRLFINDRKK